MLHSKLGRRDFLTHMALGVAAIARPRHRSGSYAPEPSGMFLSLPPWAVARNVGWPEQARIAARVGYKGVDWSFAPAKAAGVEATRALLAELGIVATIVSLPMQSPLVADEAVFETQLAKLDEDAAFSQAIGCSRFHFVLSPTTPNGQSKAERWPFVERRLSAVAAVLAKHDVRLSLEFLGPLVFRTRPDASGRTPVPFIWTLPETLKLCEGAGHNVGMTLDAWHWYHSGGTVDEIRAVPVSRILQIHVSDARAMAAEDVRDDMRLFTGEGVIDLIGFFQALKAIGYQGGVSPETLGSRIPSGMSAEESARLAFDATLAVMKRAGVA